MHVHRPHEMPLVRSTQHPCEASALSQQPPGVCIPCAHAPSFTLGATLGVRADHSTPETFTAPTHVPKQWNPCGSYRRTFHLPEGWPYASWRHEQGGTDRAMPPRDRREVYLHFEASGSSAMTLWLNGQEVGYSEDSKSVAEFRVTPFLRRGRNVLAIEVWYHARVPPLGQRADGHI